MNVLFILSDQHNPEYSGCYGHTLARTPCIDALAREGTRFEWAYSHSPICASTRAAMITGRYAHEIGAWDNVFPYTGVPRGFGHHFAEQGVRLTTIGKLDFMPGAEHGIEETLLPLHRENLDITSLYREQEILPRHDSLAKHRATGPADSMAAYAHDTAVAERAVRWLHDAGNRRQRPWVLVVNFNDLHRPWRPPREIWQHYASRIDFDQLDERFTQDWSQLHPFHRTYARHHVGELMTPKDTVNAVIGYLGSCEILDMHVGEVLRALAAAGLEEDTLTVYASDHGGTVGEHRNFDHGAMYDGSTRIPLIVRGPGVRRGVVEPTVVSALDILPTVCAASGAPPARFVRGTSLLPLLRGDADATRPDFALCEYHGAGYNASLFMVRSGRYKLVECVGSRPMLFDLEADRHEMHDLASAAATDPALGTVLASLRQRLGDICSPQAVDARAKADQRARRAELAADGRLYEGLWKRGYERDALRLVLRQ
jgi:choline-sulfatase